MGSIIVVGIIGAIIGLAIEYFQIKKKAKGKNLKLPRRERLGEEGEKRVREALSSLNPDEYLVHNDIYVRDENGELTQIDHLIFSHYGIFIIETKNYSGVIHGREKEPYWTQYFGKGKKITIRNPLHQNYGHMKALEFALGKELFMVELLCFDDRTKTNLKSNKIVKTSKLLDKIKSYTAETISPFIIPGLLDKLKEVVIEPTPEIRAEHLARIEKLKEDVV